MIQDTQGRYWMLGPDSGKWYVHDGQNSIEPQPPVIGGIPPPPSFVPAPPRGSEFGALAIIAIGVIVALCLIGAVAVLFVTSQSSLTITLANPTNRPFRLVAPSSPSPVPTVLEPPTATPIATSTPLSTTTPTLSPRRCRWVLAPVESPSFQSAMGTIRFT